MTIAAILGNLKVAVPRDAEQRAFSSRIASVERTRAAHEESLIELDALFASLPHHAFRGEI